MNTRFKEDNNNYELLEPLHITRYSGEVVIMPAGHYLYEGETEIDFFIFSSYDEDVNNRGERYHKTWCLTFNEILRAKFIQLFVLIQETK